MNKFIIGLLGLLFINQTFALVNSAEFPTTKKIEDTELVLNGTGMRKATFLGIKVYKAALYLKNKTTNPSEVISQDFPKYLELKFVRDVDAQKMRDAWSESIKNNNQNFAALSKKVETLNSAMKDIKEGQELTFTFQKNNNTKISLAGVEVANILGLDFQTALLNVWMGPKPPNDELKQGLLSGEIK